MQFFLSGKEAGADLILEVGRLVFSSLLDVLYAAADGEILDLKAQRYASVQAEYRVGIGIQFRQVFSELELGEIATPYESPDEAEEELRVARYLYRFNGIVGGNTLIGQGVGLDSLSNFLIGVVTPVPMRTDPAVNSVDLQLNEKFVNTISSSGTVKGSTVQVTGTATTSFSGNPVVSLWTETCSSNIYENYIEFDAQYYA